MVEAAPLEANSLKTDSSLAISILLCQLFLGPELHCPQWGSREIPISWSIGGACRDEILIIQ